MSRKRAELQQWYRRAMLGRISELRGLIDALRADDAAAFDATRTVGQALRGSGATFGFPELTEAATLLETSADRDVLRRAEGLIAELHAVAEEASADAPRRSEWLLRAAGLPVDTEAPPPALPVADAWRDVQSAARLDGDDLAESVARYLGLQRVVPERPGRSAVRLVPEALVASGRIVPLEEDSTSITVATAEPTSLAMELALVRLTGRTPAFVVAEPREIDAVLSVLLDDERSAAVQVVAPAAVPEPEASGAVEAPAEPRLPLPTAPRRREGSRRVLVVDDEATERSLIRSLLEKRGFEVVEAVDGVEALERVAHGPDVELVVADLNMPRVDGLELIWEIREGDRESQPPVIVVTSEVDEIIEMQLLEEGADDYIRKPLDPRLFVARVEATLRRRAV